MTILDGKDRGEKAGSSFSPQCTHTRIVKKAGEYIVRAYANGKRIANADYFTDSLSDAKGTAKLMIVG